MFHDRGVGCVGDFVPTLMPTPAPPLAPQPSLYTFYSPGVQCQGDACTSVVTGQVVQNPMAKVAIVAGSGVAAAVLINPLVGIGVAALALWATGASTQHTNKPTTQGG
jgi:hypothetical protein